MLVRATTVTPELFMVKRHEKSSFGAAYAFPGGVVDVDDNEVHEFCAGVDAAAANANLGVERDGLGYYSAAIRELFEESGVLLADPDAVVEDLAMARDALNENNDRWAHFVARNQLELRCDDLHYISHWITPPQQAKRYSTRFFVAEMPEGQTASHCGGELVDSCWATAHDVLEAGRAGKVELHFPTIKTLECIARHTTLSELMEWASSCSDWGVTSMLPMIIDRDGKKEIALPGDKDYPGALS